MITKVFTQGDHHHQLRVPPVKLLMAHKILAYSIYDNENFLCFISCFGAFGVICLLLTKSLLKQNCS